MLKVAACDDNILFLQELDEILKADSRIEKITLYEQPEQLIKDIEEGRRIFDAVFMDIEFQKNKNGMQYVERVFQIEPQIQIIYVTGYHDRYEQQIFLTDANLTGYLTKPLDRDLVRRYIEKICEKKEPKKVLNFSMRGKEYMVTSDSISYLESDNHRTIIHTQDGMYKIYDKLSNFHSRLPSSFIQCHKSFLVNMNKIKCIEGNEICLQNGCRIPVSKIHQEKVREKYFSYIGNKV